MNLTDFATYVKPGKNYNPSFKGWFSKQKNGTFKTKD